MRVTVIRVLIGALGTIPKGLEMELEELEIGGTNRTIQTTALLKISQNTEKSPGDLRRTFYHSASSERPSANTGVKNSQEVNVYYNTKAKIDKIDKTE